MFLFVLSVSIALCSSFLCSLCEAALLSISPAQVAELTAKHPRLGAIWHNLKTHIERPIAVILLVNTAALTIGSSFAGAQLDEIGGQGKVWLFSVAFTFFMLQFGEMLPKTLGVRFSRDLAPWLGPALSTLVTVLMPVIKLISLINRPFAGKPKHGTATVDEIAALAGLARLSNQISRHQEQIIKSASRLSRLRVKQVMIPLEQVAMLSTDQKLWDAVAAAHIDTHTRFPVCEDGQRSKIVGYVNFKEMIYFMRTNPKDPSLRGIIRPVYYVGPEDSASELLRVFMEQHVHIAIVRNEQSDAVGLVTLEDIVEELVGELEDDFERLPTMLHPLSGGTWMVGGGVRVQDLETQLNIKLPDDAGSVSAWIRRRLGHLPRSGEVHKEDGLEFTIRRTRRGRVFEVAVSKV
jgi:CBS domain containing-hemolysin-like protein